MKTVILVTLAPEEISKQVFQVIDLVFTTMKTYLRMVERSWGIYLSATFETNSDFCSLWLKKYFWIIAAFIILFQHTNSVRQQNC
jgi:hypothetical protein